MNNKGLTLIELIAVIIIIGVVAYIAVPSVSSFIGNGKLQTFISYESSMETAAKNSVISCTFNNSTKCEITPEKGKITDVKLSKLIEEGFIDEITAPNGGKCDLEKSFVRVQDRGNLNYKFTTCLYCDDYTTSDDLCK